MELADYQSRIATEAALLRAAAVSVDSDTAVPTCPGWTVQRLLQHVGRVFDMVIRVLRTADSAVAADPRRATAVRRRARDFRRPVGHHAPRARDH